MNELNPKIKEIVSVLYRLNGGMSAHEISVKTKISYLTVQKYLEILVNKGIVTPIKESSKKKFKRRGQTIKYSISSQLIVRLEYPEDFK